MSCVQLCGNLQMLLASSWRKQKKPSLASGVRVDFGLNTLRSCLYLACWTVQVKIWDGTTSTSGLLHDFFKTKHPRRTDERRCCSPNAHCATPTVVVSCRMRTMIFSAENKSGISDFIIFVPFYSCFFTRFVPISLWSSAGFTESPSELLDVSQTSRVHARLSFLWLEPKAGAKSREAGGLLEACAVRPCCSC